MKKTNLKRIGLKKIGLIVFLAVVLAMAALATSVYLEIRHVADEDAGSVLFEVAPGDGFSAVVARLQTEGIVEKSFGLKIYAKLTGRDRRIRRGIYELSPADRPIDTLDKLVFGIVKMVSVTIPEGYMKWDIAASFEAVGIDSITMYDALEDPSLLAERQLTVGSLEGYLFPDTYQIVYGTTADRVVEQMLARLDAVFSTELIQRTMDQDMTPHEVLTLASIVEAEARVADERPRIAAVYRNRIRRGMRLEADPTVAYAMGGYRGRLLYKDLEIDSPYNTYRNRGLPPGPICSAGEASIRAALYPDTTSQALYFVARGDGSHIFSMTLREHQAATRRARAEKKRGGASNETNAQGEPRS